MKLRLIIGVACIALSHQALAQSTTLPSVNRSQTIGLANVFQVLIAASSSRKSLTMENNNVNGDNCWIHIGAGNATFGNSILLFAGGSYERYYPYLPQDQIQGTCTTTGDTIYADTQ